MSVYCLLDTNSILKRYFPEAGTEIIDYLFDRSPTAIIYLANVQVVEVIRILHSLRAENRIKSDHDRDAIIDSFLKDIDIGTNNGKIKLYGFANEHLKDQEVYIPVFQIPRPISYVKTKNCKIIKIKKKRADTIDTIMLIIMREVHFLSDTMKEEGYLVTSDEHVLDVANYLKLKTINPEKIKIFNMPPSLDARKQKRNTFPLLKVICNDCLSDQPLGSTSTIDFCEGGICIRKNENFIVGRTIKIRMSSFNDHGGVIERSGEIIRLDAWKSVLKFSEPVSSELFSSITNN